MILDVHLEEVFPHPVEAVWEAITDPEAISGWLMVTSGFEPRVGAAFRLKTDRLSVDGWVRAEVRELEPPRRMVWSWSVDDGIGSSTVVFELVPEGGGTRLTLTHVGEINDEAGAEITGGWPSRIELLRRNLDRA
jgi:uncharacterized protein YndB with AHSA1/START domain